MPDAHVGYGLPIGGVLATDRAVIPYAVGVDIACRMKLTVYDRAASTVVGQRDRLANLLESETRFGVGANFKQRKEHEVMDHDWSVSPITRQLRDKAWTQLGTSGSGNHFVEFGVFTVKDAALGPAARRIRGAPEPQRIARHRCEGVRLLQQARDGPARGFCPRS